MAGREPGRSPGGAAAVPGELRIEVAAGVPERQAVVTVSVPVGSTVMDAVQVSGLLERFPEFRGLDLDLTVRGVRVDPDCPVAADDRVELLRPLRVDPRESRRRRARRRGGGSPQGGDRGPGAPRRG